MSFVRLEDISCIAVSTIYWKIHSSDPSPLSTSFASPDAFIFALISAIEFYKS